MFQNEADTGKTMKCSPFMVYLCLACVCQCEVTYNALLLWIFGDGLNRDSQQHLISEPQMASGLSQTG